MQFLSQASGRAISWACTLLFSGAAWLAASLTLPGFLPGAGLFFAIASCLSAAAGGMAQAWFAILLNAAAFNLFAYMNQPAIWSVTSLWWSLPLVALALIVGYARQKWSSAEMLAGHLSNDLARMRDELEMQRSDLKRFHDLSMKLSSNLDPGRLLNEVLSSIAALHKTDLAFVLLLPEMPGKVLRMETSIGFTAGQIKLFGDFPTAFFSLERRVVVEDLEEPGAYFPFVDAAAQIGLRGVLSMPVCNAKGEALGVLATFFRRTHSPSSRQMRLAELYTRQAANALDNARLYRKSMETLAAEQRRSAVLGLLAEASVQINSARTVDSLLQTITDRARDIIGAGKASTTLLARGTLNQTITCSSVAEGWPALEFPQASSEMFMLACTLNKPVRLSPGVEDPRSWRAVNKTEEAERRGWLAAPLLTRDGRNLGLIQLSGKLNGSFTPDDEALLVQMTHMASVAIDNVRLYREAREQLAETRRAQEALERSQETMRLAQECVGIGVWEWDLVTGDLAWSDEARRLHGFSPGALDSRYESWMESIHPDDRGRVAQSVKQAIRTNTDYEVQYRVVSAGQSPRWLEARGRTMALGHAPLRMVCVVMDINGSKLAEEALRNSEKLAATGRLAASIAHEINNPLAAVTNVLYILRSNPQFVAGAGLDYVKTAEAELQRVIHITRQTLGLYREQAAPVMTSVPGLLDEVLAAYTGLFETNSVTVRKKYGCPGQVMGFPGELRQVFSNLILNAVEAMPAGGALAVRLQETRQGREGLKITVADNGPGIAQANRRRLFEPFFSTKDAKGTGLGLWVSQGIVQKHGGSIRVRSSSGELHHGTCFAVFLPFVSRFAEQALAIRPEQPPDMPRSPEPGVRAHFATW